MIHVVFSSLVRTTKRVRPISVPNRLNDTADVGLNQIQPKNKPRRWRDRRGLVLAMKCHRPSPEPAAIGAYVNVRLLTARRLPRHGDCQRPWPKCHNLKTDAGRLCCSWATVPREMKRQHGSYITRRRLCYALFGGDDRALGRTDAELIGETPNERSGVGEARQWLAAISASVQRLVPERLRSRTNVDIRLFVKQNAKGARRR